MAASVKAYAADRIARCLPAAERLPDGGEGGPFGSHIVRFRIWPIDKNNAQSEQAFSADGGKTWETNWINHYTRIKSE